jgi:hypothetical protein
MPFAGIPTPAPPIAIDGYLAIPGGAFPKGLITPTLGLEPNI